jgi:hypothetical protein
MILIGMQLLIQDSFIQIKKEQNLCYHFLIKQINKRFKQIGNIFIHAFRLLNNFTFF